MSDRCNKCTRFNPDTKYCMKRHRDVHARDHVCSYFKPRIPSVSASQPQPLERPETVCPVCKHHMFYNGFELNEEGTHIVIHYGCNVCGVHIKQHFSCQYQRTETDRFPDRETRLKQASCRHHFLYHDTRSSVVSPDCCCVWDNYRCSICGKIEHRNERYEPTE